MAISPSFAANRYGLGAAPQELAGIGRDPLGWLDGQLRPFDGPLQGQGLVPSDAALREFFTFRADRKAAKEKGDPLGGYGKEVQAIYRAELSARLRAAVTTEAPFRERLLHFWANHFTVSAHNKLVVAPVAGAYVREAIRPHVMGRFGTLLKAAEQHPGMLLYLDNAQSIGPGSPAGSRTGKGLNENLAREVLELHTLGVGGGYTQADVTSFAKVLTGWTLGNKRLHPQRIGAFVFEPRLHEPGAQTVLGKRYAEGGLAQGEAVLADLARHPATHRHLAEKLARHFIADDPPPNAVARLAGAFASSDGDLPTVYRALLKEAAAPLVKLKSPEEFLVSTLRGLGLTEVERYGLAEALTLLGQRPFLAPSPQGFPDRAEAWAGPDAIKTRLDYANQVALRAGGKIDARARAPLLLGAELGPRTAQAIARAASGPQALTLLLMSPEFQRR